MRYTVETETCADTIQAEDGTELLAYQFEVPELEVCRADGEIVNEAETDQEEQALTAAETFNARLEITGVILTKLDGTAKGGIAVAIQSELDIPVKYIGVGESIDDLQKFDADAFVNALFDVNMDDIGELHLPEEEAGETDAEE
mgnify:CR=1 FL=1